MNNPQCLTCAHSLVCWPRCLTIPCFMYSPKGCLRIIDEEEL